MRIEIFGGPVDGAHVSIESRHEPTLRRAGVEFEILKGRRIRIHWRQLLEVGIVTDDMDARIASDFQEFIEWVIRVQARRDRLGEPVDYSNIHELRRLIAEGGPGPGAGD